MTYGTAGETDTEFVRRMSETLGGSLDWIGDASIIKAGVDTLRSALALFKDVQGVLPKGEKSDAIAMSLVAAEQQLRLADAEIAKGFGYKIVDAELRSLPR